MVSARLPQGFFTRHAVVTYQRIHNGVLKGMTHVQAARYIRGRKHHAIGVMTRCGGFEMSVVFPNGVPFAFDAKGVVGFVHESSVVLVIQKIDIL